MDRRMTDGFESENNVSKTIVSENTKISGDITGDEEVSFSGQFEGKMDLKSLLIVKRPGKMKGTIKVENMVVEGEVKGNVTVQNKIELRATGKFQGKVVCRQIAIEEGAFFKGDVNMEDGKNVDPVYYKEKRGDLKKS